VTALLLAVLLDLSVGDPPGRWHPVAWLGRLIGLGRRLGSTTRSVPLLIYGGVLVAVVTGVAAAIAFGVERGLRGAPGVLSVIVEAVLLKLSFSLRGLGRATELVRGHLVAGDLAGARRELGIHLVSRATAHLDRGLVASGAVESLAENLTDSWVAPLCFFLVGGLPAAWAYRAVNTADAMIGYRDGDLLYRGRVAARLDDVLNFVPARLAALAIVAAAPLAGQSAAGAWRILRSDAHLTASPNAGVTMAAMAGALGVRLEKPGHYRIGRGAPPDVEAIDRALALFWGAAALVLGAAVLALTFWPSR
jgi:adenosylcobinamide-phosphate synthase